MPRGAVRTDVPDRKHYDLTVDGLTDTQQFILGWPDEWAAHGLVDDEIVKVNAPMDKLGSKAAKL